MMSFGNCISGLTFAILHALYTIAYRSSGNTWEYWGCAMKFSNIVLTAPLYASSWISLWSWSLSSFVRTWLYIALWYTFL